MFLRNEDGSVYTWKNMFQAARLAEFEAAAATAM